MPLADLNDAPRSTNAPVPGQDECEKMFGHFLENNQNDPKHKLNDDEQKKIRSSFQDPKFREMLADYMEEISDPKYRAETEQYISQMENDDQVPAGKELVRPEACFVVKTHIVPNDSKDDKDLKGEKLFVNIVQSPQIAPPVGTPVNGGMQWSLPLSVGPKRFEKDKEGGTLVPTFDACFHPEALRMVRENKVFRDYVVSTALENVQASLNGSTTNIKDFVRKEYHVLRGVPYKNGTPAIMMMSTDKMSNVKKSTDKSKPSKAVAAAQAVATGNSGGGSAKASEHPETSSKNNSNNKKKNKNKGKKNAGDTAVKKGFLNSTSEAATKKKISDSTSPPSLITEVNEIDKEQPITQAKNKKNGNTTTTTNPLSVDKKNVKSNQENNSNNGAIAPTYHMKERGSYRISDSMQTRVVQPSRPTELEVIIELPSLATKSQMDLDVSTDKLKFTALRSSPTSTSLLSSTSSSTSSYELNIKLPYPCDGEKGKAKFDKVKKELRVTIPVIPPKYVKEVEVIGARSNKASTSGVEDVTNSLVTEVKSGQNTSPSHRNEEGEEEEEEEHISERTRKEQLRAKSIEQQKMKSKQPGQVDHSKWLNPMESKRMTFDIPEGAKLVASTPKPPSTNNKKITDKATVDNIEAEIDDKLPVKSKRVVKASSIPSTSSTLISNLKERREKLVLTKPFEESKIFKGYVSKYVFKLGELGLGYYLDNYYEKETKDTSLIDKEDVSVIEDLIAPYDFKQMNEVLTVLVQVAQINSESVEIKFNDKQMLLSFMTKSANETIPSSSSSSDDDPSLKRYTLILKTSGSLAVEKCRYDVADKNMIVVLYKLKEEFWETPFLAVASEEYNLAFPSSSIQSDATASGGGTSSQLEEDDLKLQASLRSIEKAASLKSLKATAQIPRATITSSQSVVGGKSVGGNDIVAPTSFQNTIMFELD